MATLVQLGCISHLPIVVDGVVLDSSRPAQSLEIIEWLHSHCVSVTMGSLSVVIFFLIQCYPIHPFHSVSRSGTDRGGGCYFPTQGRLGCLFVLFVCFFLFILLLFVFCIHQFFVCLFKRKTSKAIASNAKLAALENRGGGKEMRLFIFRFLSFF